MFAPFATYLLKDWHDIRTIQALLGQQYISKMMIYTTLHGLPEQTYWPSLTFSIWE